MQLIGEVEPLAGARALIEDLKAAGHVVVLASSAKPEELEHYLTLLDARALVDGVDRLRRRGDDQAGAGPRASRRWRRPGAKPKDAVMIGDSTWDCLAAKAAKVRSIGVLTGGFSREELLEAGASKVFDTVEDLRQGLEDTILRV